ncbi:NAD-dependent deacylase [Pasteurellaceae bacterium RH1A]|nr:NAD-dependent deacylase [Pasteurellaceae bacterium RH1A]
MKTKAKCVVLTGAGISAESGLSTFRDNDGLWANYRIEEVCTPEALARNPQKVIEFYNYRRQEAEKAQPNAGHLALVELEERYEVKIVTQNVDNLHEKAGSSTVLHLHGQLNKLRSSFDEDYVIDWQGDQPLDLCDPQGHPMRPHIVFFGESVPLLDTAIDWVAEADVLIIIGTSMQVYPANTLIQYARPRAEIYFIDPHPQNTGSRAKVIAEKAGVGVLRVVKDLLAKS